MSSHFETDEVMNAESCSFFSLSPAKETS